MLALSRRKKWIAVWGLVAALGVIAFLRFAPEENLPPAIILPPNSCPAEVGRFPDCYIPQSWTFVHKFCTIVFGAPKRIDFNIRFLKTSNTLESIMAENHFGPPLAQSNGVALWIVPEDKVKWPSGWSSDALSCAGFDGVMYREGFGWVNGPNEIFSAEAYPKLKETGVDVSLWIEDGHPGGQMFEAQFRAQLPYDKAIFWVKVGSSNSEGIQAAGLVTAEQYDSKGNKMPRKQAQTHSP